MMTDDDPIKVCPECGGEYQLTASVCVDCGVPLVLPEEIAEREARELRLRPSLVLVRTAPILWIRALAADLEWARIPYAIDRRKVRDEGLLSLYVKREDREAAAALDGARLKTDPLEMDDEPSEEEREEDLSREEDEEDYKVCPECGADFRPEIERCAYCGVELVKPGKDEDPDPEELSEEVSQGKAEERLTFPHPPRHEIPASDDLVCLCCGSFSFLTSLSAKLDEAGIGHRIELGPYETSATNACLYLDPEDCDTAEEIWDAANDADEDFTSDGRTCSACGTSLPRNAPDCPECGLSFDIVPEVTCRHCGAILVGAGKRCPNCGSVIRAR